MGVNSLVETLREMANDIEEQAPALESAVEACRMIVAHYERSDSARGRGPTLTECVAKAREVLRALGEEA